ncbi:MAG TPA: helix-turn-helix transcriptional regulator [Gemmataceae bacterium]|nr:helix-turn-helix transcriptional regulator [Gemmataceae bacterium]
MKADTATGKGPAPRYRMVDGKRMVLLEEGEYERLRAKADEWEPLLPEPDADGNYPAVAYARASLARKIVRQRRRLGLTQVELARRAGIRPETLNRVEQGKHTPTVATVEKIDRALREAEAEG